MTRTLRRIPWDVWKLTIWIRGVAGQGSEQTRRPISIATRGAADEGGGGWSTWSARMSAVDTAPMSTATATPVAQRRMLALRRPVRSRHRSRSSRCSTKLPRLFTVRLHDPTCPPPPGPTSKSAVQATPSSRPTKSTSTRDHPIPDGLSGRRSTRDRRFSLLLVPAGAGFCAPRASGMWHSPGAVGPPRGADVSRLVSPS